MTLPSSLNKLKDRKDSTNHGEVAAVEEDVDFGEGESEGASIV
jgi:hypothetical protein